MLDFFSKLDSNVLRGLLVAVASLVGLIVNSVFNISEEAWGEKAEKIIDAVIQIIALGGAIWAGYARINQPNPNLSVTANEKEAKMVAEGKIPEHLATKGVVDAMPPEAPLADKVFPPEGGFTRLPFIFAVLVLSACAVLGVPQPQSFNERVAFTMSGVTATREAATELVSNGVITPDDAQNVQQQADTAREGVDLAVAFHATKPEQAEAKLAAAQVIVAALKDYIVRNQEIGHER